MEIGDDGKDRVKLKDTRKSREGEARFIGLDGKGVTYCLCCATSCLFKTTEGIATVDNRVQVRS